MNKTFIMGSGRCGTTLIRSLLDGHPQLNVYPVEVTKFLENFIISAGYEPVTDVQFINQYMLSNLGVDSFGEMQPSNIGMPKINLTTLNKQAFQDVMISAGEKDVDANEYFEMAFQALNAAKNARDDHVMQNVLDVTTVNISAYLRYFKDAKLIVMLRHPVDAYNSYKKVYYKNVDHILGSSFSVYMPQNYFERLYTQYSELSKHQGNPNICTIRLEDLQDDTEKTMKTIADFLKIDFVDSLLKPSVLGDLFKGNTYAGDAEAGKVLKSNYSDEYVTDQEKYLLEKGIRCQDYYAIDLEKASVKDKSFRQFMRQFKGWWKSKQRFPNSGKHFLYGLLAYYRAYKRYKAYIHNYYNRFDLMKGLQ